MSQMAHHTPANLQMCVQERDDKAAKAQAMHKTEQTSKENYDKVGGLPLSAQYLATEAGFFAGKSGEGKDSKRKGLQRRC